MDKNHRTSRCLAQVGPITNESYESIIRTCCQIKHTGSKAVLRVGSLWKTLESLNIFQYFTVTNQNH